MYFHCWKCSASGNKSKTNADGTSSSNNKHHQQQQAIPNSWASTGKTLIMTTRRRCRCRRRCFLFFLLLCGLMTLPKLRLSRIRLHILSHTHARTLTHSRLLLLPCQAWCRRQRQQRIATPCGRTSETLSMFVPKFNFMRASHVVVAAYPTPSRSKASTAAPVPDC